MKKLIVYLFLIIFFFQAVLSMRHKSATTDENPHLAAGYTYLKKGDFRMNPEHPALIKLLAGLPLMFMGLDFKDGKDWDEAEEWNFADEFLYKNKLPVEKILFWGRIPIVLLGVILGFLVFSWAKEMYGYRAGLFALFLYSFSPNILANTRLVTMDLGISMFMFLSIYLFFRLLKKPSTKYIIINGIAFGLCLAAKYSAVIILPIYIMIMIVFAIRNKQDARKFAVMLSVIFVIGIVTLLACYRVVSIDKYIQGMRRTMNYVQLSGHPTFLMGKHAYTGWRHYFLVAFLIKTPIPTILFLVLTAYMFLVKKARSGYNYFLLIPAVTVFLVSSVSRMQLGLRYILPVYPFLFVWISGLVSDKNPAKPHPAKAVRAGILTLCLWYFLSSLSIYPHYLAYFNEFIGGPKNGYKYLLDSNLDYGQDLNLLRKYWINEGRPELLIFYAGSTPLPIFKPAAGTTRELIAVSVNRLQGIFYEKDRKFFKWLKNREPIRRIGHTIFVYNVKGDVEANLNLGIMYAREGKAKFAIVELARAEAIDPDFTVPGLAAARIITGNYYLNRNMSQEAEVEYFKAIKADSAFPGAHYGLGMLYEKKGRQYHAIKEYENELLLDPTNASAHKNVGILYNGLGMTENTILHWEKYIELAPDAADREVVKQVLAGIKKH